MSTVYCFKCGAANEEQSSFCIKCGNKLVTESGPDISINQFISKEELEAANTISRNKNLRLIILISVLACCILLLGAIIFLIVNGKTGDRASKEDIEVDSEKEFIQYDYEQIDNKNTTSEIEEVEEKIDKTEDRSIEVEEEYVETPDVVEEVSEDPEWQNENSTTEYILPYSDSQYLSESDLQSLSNEELRIARNELYARHGRRFKDEGLQSYFDSQSWYNGRITPEEWDESLLNEYEVYNRDLIVKYEKKTNN